MTRAGRLILVMLAVLALVWGAGRLFLEVELPAANERRGAFPDPMDTDLSLRAAFDALPAEGGGMSRMRLLDENAEAWAERWRLLAGAKERLDISYFILKEDVFGAAFLGHLLVKAREGVRVRVILDAMGTAMSRRLRGSHYLGALVGSGNVTVRIHRPLRYRVLDTFLTFNPAAIFASDHDKILLADDRLALIGGRNISVEYFTPGDDEPAAFRDIDLLLAGPEVAAALKAAFEAQYQGGEAQDIGRNRLNVPDWSADLLLAYHAMDAWLQGTPVPPAVEATVRERELSWLVELRAMPGLRGVLRRPRGRMEYAEVKVLDSYTRLIEADDPITRSLIRLVRSARQNVFIQNPYLVLPREAVDLLQEAAGRGVAIRLLTNSPRSTDNPLSQAFFLQQWPALLARVPQLRLYVPGDRRNIHGKVAVIDQKLALIGTYNLDPFSMSMNGELVVAVWSRRFAERVLRRHGAFIAAGPPRVYEYRIARGAEGEPVRDRGGDLVEAYGADDHDEVPPAVRRYRALIEGLRDLPVDVPLLDWTEEETGPPL